MNTIVMLCRACDKALRYQRPNNTTRVWFCESCGWRAHNDSHRLDELAYGVNRDATTGQANRYYPDQWGR